MGTGQLTHDSTRTPVANGASLDLTAVRIVRKSYMIAIIPLFSHQEPQDLHRRYPAPHQRNLEYGLLLTWLAKKVKVPNNPHLRPFTQRLLEGWFPQAWEAASHLQVFIHLHTLEPTSFTGAYTDLQQVEAMKCLC